MDAIPVAPIEPQISAARYGAPRLVREVSSGASMGSRSTVDRVAALAVWYAKLSVASAMTATRGPRGWITWPTLMPEL